MINDLKAKSNEMKFQTLILSVICITILFGCSKQKIIKLPLSTVNNYGNFKSSFGQVSPYYYSKDGNNPWRKTDLSVTGVPKNLTEIKFGDITIDQYQSTYQDYLLGKITKKMFVDMQKTMSWNPDDTLQLSKEPLKTKIAFAFGKDSTGHTKWIVDANNNLDFSDDKIFTPFYFSTPTEKVNKDSIGLSNAITISYERLIDNKKQLVTAPLFIAYLSQHNMYGSNFSQYSITTFNGEKIAVCSDHFLDLSYENSSIVLINDSLKDGDKINREKLTAKNEFIEIKGEFYKNIGVNKISKTLELEKMMLPKSELYSTQVGFKSFPFKENDFMKESPISSEQLKGKYILLDFWGIWCGPCIREIPNLKELYAKIDREKFEIVSVHGDDTPSNLIKEFIEKNSLNWPQILSTNSNKIVETYGIHEYPTTFLINPEGVIIAKNLRGKKLYKRVLELINE